MKIAIIGMPGSGKSTLGFRLHATLGMTLYHLDQYFWGPGWQKPDRAVFEKMHKQLCDQETWIIEGCAIRLIEYRIARADIVIFLDVPTRVCLYRVFKRSFLNFGKIMPSSAKGCPEGILSFEFLRYIWCFNARRRPYIVKLLREYHGKKKVFTITNNTQLDVLMQKFESNRI